MREINYLFNNKNLKIVQDTQMFKFSLDSILLPNFVNYNMSYKKILDIGTGNAPIPIIMSQKTNAKIDAIEVQNDVFKLAKESIQINNLENQVNLINDNVIGWYNKIETDTYDLIVCNPPYFKNVNENLSANKKIARHENDLTIDNIMKISKKILKNKGKVVIVHRTERLIDIIDVMKKHNIEPKRLQFIYPKYDSDSNIMLIEGTKNGKAGLKLLKPIYTHNEDGSYTDQIKQYFE